MKPSKFLDKKGLITNKKELIKDNKNYIKLKGLNKFIIDKFHEKLFKNYEELDKRFIDREELKKQINKLFFDLRQTIPKEEMKPNKKEILAIESLFYIQGEILELLK